MIKITRVNLQTDLFSTPGPEIMFKVENQITKEKSDHKIMPNKANSWKMEIIQKEASLAIKNMYNQRRYALQHYESNLPQNKWNSVLEIEKSLKKLKELKDLKDLHSYLRYIKQHVIFRLENIGPNPGSKHFNNYQSKLNSMKHYINIQLLSYQRISKFKNVKTE